VAVIYFFLKILPNGKAGNALKQASSEITGAVKTSELTRETTQVATAAKEGKPRSKTGRNTQTNSISDHKGCKPVKLLRLRASDLGMHLTWPNGTYFKPNYGRWAPLVIYKGTEAAALSSKSIGHHLAHSNAVENLFFNMAFVRSVP